VVGEEQPSGDAVERQRLSKKTVIHPIGAIDRDLQMCVLATTKLIQAIGRNSGRMPKSVRHNGFPDLRVNPKNHLSGLQRTFDLRDAHLVFLKIVGEVTGAGAFIAHYTKIVASGGAVGEMDGRAPAVHPRAPEPRPPLGDGAFAPPILWMLMVTSDPQSHRVRWL